MKWFSPTIATLQVLHIIHLRKKKIIQLLTYDDNLSNSWARACMLLNLNVINLG